MATTYCTTKQVCEFLQIQNRVPESPATTTNEAVGTGDGNTTVFWLDHGNVITGSYYVYDNGAAVTEGAGAGKFTIDKDTGAITFGTAPILSHAITAKYWYASIADSVIEALINRAEDQIDQRTRHAWRTRYSGTTTGADVTAKYEYYDIDSCYDSSVGGRKIFLNHRKITAFSHAASDVLEVWNGSAYEDYIQTKTEGRDDDFWVDYELGVLYISRYENLPRGIRLKYRYGEATVPYDIADCACKLAALDLVKNGYVSLLPQGSNMLGMTSRIEILQKDVDNCISRHTESIVP